MRYQPLRSSSGKVHIVTLNSVSKAIQSGDFPPIDWARRDHLRGLKTSISIIRGEWRITWKCTSPVSSAQPRNTNKTKLAVTGHFLGPQGHLSAFSKGFSSLNFPHPLLSPSSPDNPLLLYWLSYEHSSALFKGFHHSSSPTHTCHPFLRVFVIEVPHPGLLNNLQLHFHILVTMSLKDLFNSVMYILHATFIPRTDATRYNVSNSNILQL